MEPIDFSQITSAADIMRTISDLLKEVAREMIKLDNHIHSSDDGDFEDPEEKKMAIILMLPIFNLIAALALTADDPDFYKKFIMLLMDDNKLIEFIEESRAIMSKEAAELNLSEEVKAILKTKPIVTDRGN